MDREVPSLFTSYLLLRSNYQQAITSITPLYDYHILIIDFKLVLTGAIEASGEKGTVT